MIQLIYVVLFVLCISSMILSIISLTRSDFKNLKEELDSCVGNQPGFNGCQWSGLNRECQCGAPFAPGHLEIRMY